MEPWPSATPPMTNAVLDAPKATEPSAWAELLEPMASALSVP